MALWRLAKWWAAIPWASAVGRRHPPWGQAALGGRYRQRYGVCHILTPARPPRTRGPGGVGGLAALEVCAGLLLVQPMARPVFACRAATDMVRESARAKELPSSPARCIVAVLVS